MPAQQQIGIVISVKMQKTIVVKIESRYPHKINFKTIKKIKKYLVHDEDEHSVVGDRVVIEACRPLSRRKHYKLINILSKSSLID